MTWRNQALGAVAVALSTTACGGGTNLVWPDKCEGLSNNYDVSLAPEQGQSSQTFTMRLYVGGNGCSARIAPSGYPAVTRPVTVTTGALRIDDEGSELPALVTGWYWGLHFFREYHFKEIVLDRGKDGALDGVAHARVDLQWAEDDICNLEKDWPWTGTLGADTSAPVLAAGGRSVRLPDRPGASCMSPTGGKARPGLPDAILPWETLAVEASEPVAGLAAGLGVSIDGTPIATSFADAPMATDVWAWAKLPDWDAVNGKAISVHAADALTDIAGHRVKEQMLPVVVLDVGPALASHDFERLGDVGVFGTVTAEDGVLRVEAPCNSGTGGIAGRLITTGATRVKMRLRHDAGTSVTTDVTGKSGTIYAGATAYEDDWQTVAIPIQSESEIGFTIVPISLCHWTSSAIVWVDRVWAE